MVRVILKKSKGIADNRPSNLRIFFANCLVGPAGQTNGSARSRARAIGT